MSTDIISYAKLVNSNDQYPIDFDVLCRDLLTINKVATQVSISQETLSDVVVVSSKLFLHCENGGDYIMKNLKYFLSLAGLVKFLGVIQKHNVLSVKDNANKILREVIVQQAMKSMNQLTNIKRQASELGVDLNF